MNIRTVKIRNMTLGAGRPKICIPIVGRTREDILAEAGCLLSLPADLAEWRADWYEEITDTGKTLSTLSALRETLGSLPLLFTFRTEKEGGGRAISAGRYEALNAAVAESGSVDLLDVEAFFDEEMTPRIIERAHAAGVCVIASNHDFSGTPAEDEIIRRLCKMQEFGADLPKIAVMPNSKQDVITLLSATLKMHETYADRPIITMSMSADGAISRIAGAFSGSAVTFGCAAHSSAPGQIEAHALKAALDIL